MSAADERTIAMRVAAVVVDPQTQSPVLVLRGIADPRLYLPIFIGGLEATAIATVLAGVELPRPMTHDLFVQTLGHLGWRLDRVTVTELLDGTFYAELRVVHTVTGEVQLLDARPSDSVALALRCGAEIQVAEPVLEEAGGLAEEGEELAGRSGPDPGEAEEDDAAAGAEASPPADSEAPSPILADADVNLEDLEPENFGKYKM